MKTWETKNLDGWPEHSTQICGVLVEAYTAKPSYNCAKRYLVRVWLDGFVGNHDFEADTLDQAYAGAAKRIARVQKKKRVGRARR